MTGPRFRNVMTFRTVGVREASGYLPKNGPLVVFQIKLPSQATSIPVPIKLAKD